MTAFEIAADVKLKIGTVRGYIQQAAKDKSPIGKAIAEKNDKASRGKIGPANYNAQQLKLIYSCMGRVYGKKPAPKAKAKR